MIRKIIEIDEDKCDGCGLCIPACPEGAIQMIDGKARLVKDFYCDGLGACLGHCPQGAINVIEREAEEYDEQAVLENVIRQGPAVIAQHLEHLKEHGEHELLAQAQKFLKQKQNQPASLQMMDDAPQSGGCPGSQNKIFEPKQVEKPSQADVPSALNHWPIQMHLISPQAPQYQGSDLLLAADCVAFSLGNFHQKYLQKRTLAIACPKLDQQQDIYLDKLVALIKHADIKSLSVMIMQVPCCSGLAQMAQRAVAKTGNKIPVRATVVGLNGEILNDVLLNK
jgi:NAD-dependent dihydropyrimidine dehydrogenase PreA subunit